MTMERNGESRWPYRGPRPADQLAGMDLENGWRVEYKMKPREDSTGGTFSVPYIVTSREGERAFLKAMDYTSSFAGHTVMDRLFDTIQNFRHELGLLQRCTGMSRVVRLLDYGEAHVNPNEPFSAVFFLIFELASNDIRAHVQSQDDDNIGHFLLLMHQVTVALQQLHLGEINHLDIKPSNVLMYCQRGAKLADLGRSIQNGETSPFSSLSCVGDMRYAPPELLYAGVRPEWQTNRNGCDFYLLGNLMFFLITQTSLTQLMLGRLAKLNAAFHHSNRSISYGEVFPYVNKVFFQIIRDLRIDLTCPPRTGPVIMLVMGRRKGER